MKLYEDLKYRDLVYDMTDEAVIDMLNNEKVSFYYGADPTGDSLHVGHLLGYIVAKRLQNKGHKPILLIGGATGLIGDPSGRNSERDLLTLEKSLENGKAIHKQASNLVECDMVNNYDWVSKMNAIEFLRDYGKNFNINTMMSKDSVKSRLDSGISFTEFSYQIIQALDFKHLYENNNCKLQIGGQDQWGNIVAGTELIRKSLGHESKAYGFTIPLLLRADGTKFGKTADGHSIWLDKNKTSVYEFYQFWVNTPDSEVISHLKKFTFLTKEEIEKIEESFAKEPHLRLAQKTLGKEVTTLVHGEDEYNKAINITNALFSGKVADLSATEIEIGFKDFPTLNLSEDGNLVDVLIDLKLASSKRESRDFIKNNAVSINGEKINDLEFVVSSSNAIEKKFTIIRRGKKKYGLIKHS